MLNQIGSTVTHVLQLHMFFKRLKLDGLRKNDHIWSKFHGIWLWKHKTLVLNLLVKWRLISSGHTQNSASHACFKKSAKGLGSYDRILTFNHKTQGKVFVAT